MDWMLMPLRRYADFSGRSRRKEYWMFALMNFLFFMMIGIGFSIYTSYTVSAALRHESPSMFGFMGVFISFAMIYVLIMLVPSIAVQVRRFHDQDKSGWFVLLNFVPYIGGIVVLVFMCLEGTRGENRYGPDPKAEDMSYSQIP